MPDAQIELDPDSLNVHFAYDDDDAHVRHQVWFLDAVTVLNEMRAARALGIQTFALWGWAQKTIRCGRSGTTPCTPIRSRTLRRSSPATTWIPRAKATSCASPASMQTGHRVVTMDDDDSVPLRVSRDHRARR